MDKLWAPWRSKYIYKLGKAKRCIFCGNRTSRRDEKRYIISRSKYAFSILNLYPYNNGHIMVAPFRHIGDVGKLSDAELLDMMHLLKNSKKTLDKKLKPHGYNIGMNLGHVGGAGFAGHLHIHIVPRWSGDTNFMSVLADTKIVSDSLSRVYKILKWGGQKC